MMRIPIRITDSTGGAVSATRAVTNTTATIKDDVATMAKAINDTNDLVRALARRLLEDERK